MGTLAHRRRMIEGVPEPEPSSDGIIEELSKVSPPILKMIVDSHNGLLDRVEMLETGLKEKQILDRSELMEALQKIEKRRFPIFGGVKKEHLTSAMSVISKRLDEQDRAIKAVKETLGRKRIFDFDFIRDTTSQLIVKITATEKTERT